MQRAFLSSLASSLSSMPSGVQVPRPEKIPPLLMPHNTCSDYRLRHQLPLPKSVLQVFGPTSYCPDSRELRLKNPAANCARYDPEQPLVREKQCHNPIPTGIVAPQNSSICRSCENCSSSAGTSVDMQPETTRCSDC